MIRLAPSLPQQADAHRNRTAKSTLQALSCPASAGQRQQERGHHGVLECWSGLLERLEGGGL
jgi:hypothetical protein